MTKRTAKTSDSRKGKLVSLAKPVRRIARTGKDRDLVVEMNAYGVRLRGQRTSRVLFATWEEIAKAADVPGEMPGRFVGKKLDWLTSK